MSVWQALAWRRDERCVVVARTKGGALGYFPARITVPPSEGRLSLKPDDGDDCFEMSEILDIRKVEP